MRLPDGFESYLRKGVVRKISPNKPRAEFLKKESNVSLEGLRERIQVMGMNEKNANSIIKDCYDIVMEKIRAEMLLKGLSASGKAAHEAEVAYLFELKFPEKEIGFLNELRYFRNGINYYGKILDVEYAEKVYDFVNKFLKIFEGVRENGK